MDYNEYIGKEVLVRGNEDYDNGLIDGVLERIIPAVETEEYSDTLVVISGGEETLFPTNSVIQFLLKDSFENDETLYYYVVLRYGKTERSKEHIYMSYDYSIKPGDKVTVWEDFLYVGNVVRTGFFKKSDAPYPVEKTWLIEKKVYDRIDFMKYSDSAEYIKCDNLYKENYLNSENDHRQYIARAEYCYKELVENNDGHIESLSKYRDDAETEEDYRNFLISETEYNLDWEWCESNQTDVFYRTVWLCSRLAAHGCYNRFFFDKYVCLSLIYKHGDFNDFFVLPDIEKPLIQKDVDTIDEYLKTHIR